MEFSRKEVESATQQFSHSCLVGEGGFGRVYYAILRHAPAATASCYTSDVLSPDLLSEMTILSK